eukprot:9612449-Prorocentrum_lima.AAC.1
MITALSSTTLLDEIETMKGTKHIVDQDLMLKALKSLHIKEKERLMHLSEVRTFSACNIQDKHPQQTTECRTRQNSLDKVNTEFPA